MQQKKESPKRTASLVLTTTLKKERIAVLRLRTYDPETLLPEPYPGGAKLTIDGTQEDEESDHEILCHAAEHQWGKQFSFMINNEEKKIVLLSEVFCDEERSEKAIYGLHLSKKKLFSTIHITTLMSGIILFRSSSHIYDLSRFCEKRGVVDRRRIALLPHEKKAVRMAFHASPVLAECNA